MGAWGCGLCPSLPASHCRDGRKTSCSEEDPTSISPQESWAEALWTCLPRWSLTDESSDQAETSPPATQVTVCRC